MTAKLFAVPASHPCATVERALQVKRVPYERIDLVPVLHKAVLKVRFGTGTVPGVEFEDGTRAHGSRAIVRALEQRVPQPSLLPPPGTDRRRRVEEAEEWGDQALQPLVRRLLWQALSADTHRPGLLPR